VKELCVGTQVVQARVWEKSCPCVVRGGMCGDMLLQGQCSGGDGRGVRLNPCVVAVAGARWEVVVGHAGRVWNAELCVVW